MNALAPLTTVIIRGIEPSENPGARPEFRWIPVKDLRIDASYQRPTGHEGSRRVVGKIVEQFAWARFQPITVTPADDDTFAIIDGQHRAIAAASHPDIPEVPCWIVVGAELRDQARTFVGINRDRLAMTPLQIYRAELAGGDPDACRVQRLIDGADLKIIFAGGQKQHLPPRGILAIKTVKKMAQRHPDKPIAQGLRILSDAWPEVGGEITGSLIEAATLLCADQAAVAHFDADRMARILGDKTAEEWLDAARAYRGNFGGTVVSTLIAAWKAAYDKGLGGDRRIGPRAA